MMIWGRLRQLAILPLLCVVIWGFSTREALAAGDPFAIAQLTARAEAARDDEFKAINTLYQRAYDVFRSDNAQGRRLFVNAGRRLKAWINKYERDPGKLSFLLQQARLGLYMEAAGKEKEAVRAYQTCLRHRLLDSPDAILNLYEHEERLATSPTKRRVREVVTWRLGILTGKDELPNESQPARRRTVSKSGSSKGGTPLPPRLRDGAEKVP